MRIMLKFMCRRRSLSPTRSLLLCLPLASVIWNLGSENIHIHMCLAYSTCIHMDRWACRYETPELSGEEGGAQDAETDSTLNNFRTRVDRNHKILWVCQERVSGNAVCVYVCVCVCVWVKMAARQTQRGRQHRRQKATMRQIERRAEGQTDTSGQHTHTEVKPGKERGERRGKSWEGGRERERESEKNLFFKATGQVSRKFCRFSCCVIQNEW